MPSAGSEGSREPTEQPQGYLSRCFRAPGFVHRCPYLGVTDLPCLGFRCCGARCPAWSATALQSIRHSGELAHVAMTWLFLLTSLQVATQLISHQMTPFTLQAPFPHVSNACVCAMVLPPPGHISTCKRVPCTKMLSQLSTSETVSNQASPLTAACSRTDHCSGWRRGPVQSPQPTACFLSPALGIVMVVWISEKQTPRPE